MDDTEQHVARFLASEGYRDDELVYEPDGNVPPDFLLQSRIAIEVRRLNQNYEGVERTEGLEEAAIPFFQRMRKLVESFGPPTGGHSWFVSYDFGRPTKPWSTLKPKLTKTLSEFMQNPASMPAEYKFEKSLKIEIAPSSLKFDTFFVMGGHTDEQTGGWVVSEMIRNIEICIAEKTAKVAPYKARYTEWWLALVDRISYGILDADDIADIRKLTPAMPGWSRILIVDPTNSSHSFEL